jgi:hypothetical protein
VADPTQTSHYSQRVVVAAEERRDDSSVSCVVDGEQVVQLLFARCQTMSRVNRQILAERFSKLDPRGGLRAYITGSRRPAG